MSRDDIADIVYKNGYNAGARASLQAMKVSNIVLCILVAFCLILSVVTTAEFVSFAHETKETLSDLTAEVNVITEEFANLAYRVDNLERRFE